MQGLRGRYTQVLSDGLPLFGPPGTIGILQIPPMDLAQVEVIKGVASALYGGSALGGVINLITRQPQRDRPEREVLINRTSRGGTDGVSWLSKRGDGNWGYTFLGGGHFQDRNDIDDDGWTDLPTYRRATARPRVMWEDGSGRSVFFTVGGMAEERRGGSMPGHTAPDGQPFPENLTTRRFDAGIVARLPLGSTRFLTLRSSGLGQWHRAHVRRNAGARHPSHMVRRRCDHRSERPSYLGAGNSSATRWVLLRASCRRSATTTWCQACSRRTTSPSPAGSRFRPARVATFTTSSEIFSVRGSPRWCVRRPAGLPGFQQAPASWRPTPFIEETEAAGLSQLHPLGNLEPERGRSLSFDVGWKGSVLELNATLFRSHITDALVLHGHDIVNARGPVRTQGSELIARYHVEGMDLIATHMFVWSTEPNPDAAGRREVPLNPRHTAGVDWLWSITERVRLGVEFFYTGKQQIDESPFRNESEPYLLWGAVAEWRVGRARLFINVENLSDIRQTTCTTRSSGPRPDHSAHGPSMRGVRSKAVF